MSKSAGAAVAAPVHDHPNTHPVVIACGALVKELRATLPPGVEVTYLPAPLHNRPERIPGAVADVLATIDPERPVLVGYGDCGTGGALDAVLAAHPNAARLEGDHCYEFITGAQRFAELSYDALGTFYLTDFLTRNFDTLIWSTYKLDRHPELITAMFGYYTRVVRLAQSDDEQLDAMGRHAAERLGLSYEVEYVGHNQVRQAVSVALGRLEPTKVSA